MATLVQGFPTTLLSCPLIAQQPEALLLSSAFPPSSIGIRLVLQAEGSHNFISSPSAPIFSHVCLSKIFSHLILSWCLFLRKLILIYREFGHLSPPVTTKSHVSEWMCCHVPSYLLALSWFILWFKCKSLLGGYLWFYVPSCPRKVEPLLMPNNPHPYTKRGCPLCPCILVGKHRQWNAIKWNEWMDQ